MLLSYMRKYLSNDSRSSILINHEERIMKLVESFDKLSSRQSSIIYEDKIYDAYSVLVNILNEAKEKIIIIDNYVNKELLDILGTLIERLLYYLKIWMIL